MVDRRKFLTTLLGLGSAVGGLAVAAPVLGTIVLPFVRRPAAPEWRNVGPIDRFPPGRMTQGFVEVPRDDWAATLRTKLVYVWRATDGTVTVFSRNCTDLSCPVTWDPGSHCFYCPCHGGIFAQDGTVMAGPPARPLDRYRHRVQDGLLQVDAHSVPPVA